MKIRTAPVLFDNLKQQFQNSKLQQDDNITGKVKSFIRFIESLNLVSFLILSSIIFEPDTFFSFIAEAQWIY
jgi:hypothetical protein